MSNNWSATACRHSIDQSNDVRSNRRVSTRVIANDRMCVETHHWHIYDVVANDLQPYLKIGVNCLTLAPFGFAWRCGCVSGVRVRGVNCMRLYLIMQKWLIKNWPYIYNIWNVPRPGCFALWTVTPPILVFGRAALRALGPGTSPRLPPMCWRMSQRWERWPCDWLYRWPNQSPSMRSLLRYCQKNLGNCNKFFFFLAGCEMIIWKGMSAVFGWHAPGDACGRGDMFLISLARNRLESWLKSNNYVIIANPKKHCRHSQWKNNSNYLFLSSRLRSIRDAIFFPQSSLSALSTITSSSLSGSQLLVLRASWVTPRIMHVSLLGCS